METLKFGYILKTLRIEAGISLRELARSIDISPSYLSMVENSKQAVPTATRIAQLEEALRVPAGYLQSISRGVSSEVVSLLQEVPEAADFFQMAKSKAMTSADFRHLTSFLSSYGPERLKNALKLTSPRHAKLSGGSRGKASVGPYIWPFLSEDLIFDVADVRDKPLFLREAVTRIAGKREGLEPGAILDGLLEREAIASTGIGRGVAVPHVYAHGLDQTLVALFRIPDGLDYDTIDGKPVYMAFLSVAPRSAEEVHLKLLARIAKLVTHATFCRGVLDASGPREIIAFFKWAEAGVP